MKKKKKYKYIREIEIRYKKKRVEGDVVLGKAATDARKVVELFSDLQNESKEKLITISLNSRLRIICFEVIAIGSVESIYVRPIEALRTSIPWSPHGIIMVHNHPSGDPKPSSEDKNFTKQLLRSTSDLGVEFHDHIIIGEDKYYSFAEKGIL